MGPVWEWVSVGGGRAKGEGEYGWICFIFVYENRTIKLVLNS
jgi:hypothetical protein